ncbi:ligase-associated DNA damage response endonuclease PdeM [Pseudoroseicyclus tamaricis]|uniref:Ligase-associated DNA damage response endonuclease PdeM n=1 Tax=Pseudoroseicyclus tamaricis TaxID=2705421 RepID=A0A6B2JL03_9RHOB|nr:ligase-associated DNA damage response endonuclease PdeM [Pseudoroseicyclus tamaricis]NDV02211.1 ligase-associated DNA damage response endonuclease PdeM [Pseudoroseicyclus tamaricis]
MNACPLTLAGTDLLALPSGGLFLPGSAALVVSDLHLGRAERVAREAGPLLPPFEAAETLGRLAQDIAATGARQIVCLGDSFDDAAAADALDPAAREQLLTLQAGRRWVWIEGNHDPGPLDLGGAHLSEMRLGALTFRHIAIPGANGEVSGHYHPKLGLPGAGRPRPCFLIDASRLILPAYGCYTGGLSATSPVLTALFSQPAHAVLTGKRALKVPLPSGGAKRGGPRPVPLHQAVGRRA